MNTPTLLITRPAPEGEILCEKLNSLSIQTLYFPTLDIQPVAIDEKECHDALSAADIVIFISPNAVKYGAHLLCKKNSIIAAIGPGTRLALEKKNLACHIMPKEFNSVGLLNHPELNNINQKHIVIICGVEGKNLLEQGLIKRGASVQHMEVYRRKKPEKIVTEDLLQKTDWILITSQESVTNLIALTPKELLNELKEKPLLVSSDELRRFATKKSLRVLPQQLKSATEKDILDFFSYSI